MASAILKAKYHFYSFNITCDRTHDRQSNTTNRINLIRDYT